MDCPSDVCRFAPFYNVSSEVDFPEDQESYPVLNFVNQMLMEEDLEELPSISHDPLALQAAERSFYEVLGKDYPDSESHSIPESHNFSSFFSDSDTQLQFKKGLEEGSKFLPDANQLLVDLDHYEVLPLKETEKEEKLSSALRARKQMYRDSSDLDTGRCNKQSAFASDEVELAETFDRLLHDAETKGKVQCNYIDFEHPHGSRSSENLNARKTSRKKQVKVEALDLGALLLSCAQFVAADDHKSANEQLKLIRRHACSRGSADQRLAVPFANALEARLTGNVPNYFDTLNPKNTSPAEELRAQRVYLCAPFRQIYSFFANKMIMKAASRATTLHIVDFGIGYGFQWPSFIQCLSERAGGPPKLRITGIDIPQPGFRPAERIQQTGRHLAKYCERFQVPFEYHAVAIRNWQRIRIEDLKLARNEFLAVNCQFRFQNFLDDQTSGDKDPKDTILTLIREMNPDILVSDIVNGQFGGPFFLTRFREALFFFSTLFDLLEQNLPKEDRHRIKFEQEYLGHEVMNVVACEGSARVERPETYKQWEMRYRRVGFRQLPLDQDLIKELRAKLKEGYHSEFIFDVDGNYWTLQGWKGRTVTASCCCVPV